MLTLSPWGAVLSWGKDELNTIVISCHVAGISPSVPATRFGNAVKLLIAVGMPIEDLARTPSKRLADYYRVDHPRCRGQDALDDALSPTYTLQHLMKTGKLRPDVFEHR